MIEYRREAARSARQLNLQEVEHALSILEQERERSTLSRFQRRMFSLLTVSAYGSVVGLLLILALFVTMSVLARGGDPTSGPWFVPFFALSLVIGLFMITLMLSSFLNIPLILKAWRQRHLLRKFGLSDIVHFYLSGTRKRSQIQNRTSLLVSIIGVIIVLYAVMDLAFAFSGQRLNSERIRNVIYSFVIGISLISVRSVWFLKQRLDFLANLDRTRDAFLEYLRGAQGAPDSLVQIAAKDIGAIAGIEEIQVARKVEAIAQTVPRRRRELYALVIEPEPLAYLRRLLGVRRDAWEAIRDATDSLQADPRPADARTPRADPAAVVLAAGGHEIVYRVDEMARRVQVIDIRESERDAADA